MRRRSNPPRPVTGQLSTSGQRHWERRSRRELARPASSGGGVSFLLLLLVLGAIAALAYGGGLLGSG
jgi:hypothetical protein